VSQDNNIQRAGGLAGKMKVIQIDTTINLDRYDEVRVTERNNTFQLVLIMLK